MKRAMLFVFLLIGLFSAMAFAGEAEISLFEQSYGVESDPLLNERLERVGARMQEAAHRLYESEKMITYKILKFEDLQAFAIRDHKRIYLSLGMMTALSDRPDDEVAAAFAHEIVHIYRKPPPKRLLEILGGSLLGAIIGDAVGGERSTENGWQLGGALVASRREKDDEFLSDSEGVKLLHEAGYDPYAMARLLLLLQDYGGNGPAKIPLLGSFVSHPDTKSRIDGVTKKARKYCPIPKDLQEVKYHSIPRPSYKVFWTVVVYVPWWKDGSIGEFQTALFTNDVHEDRTMLITTSSGEEFKATIGDVSRTTHRIWIMADSKFYGQKLKEVSEVKVLPK